MPHPNFDALRDPCLAWDLPDTPEHLPEETTDD